jgi:hypothetical protein
VLSDLELDGAEYNILLAPVTQQVIHTSLSPTFSIVSYIKLVIHVSQDTTDCQQYTYGNISTITMLSLPLQSLLTVSDASTPLL